MDFREFFAIVERDLDILNPISHEKLMRLASYCGVGDGSRILDIGCGKGYLLRKWAERFEIEGVGLEINPAFIVAANERAASENVSQSISFIEGDAKEYPAQPQSFDVVTCIGAPFAIGTVDEAVDWMLGYLKPGGTLAIGDVFLRSEPPEGTADEGEIGQFRTLIENHDVLTERGLDVVGVITASEDDWDTYCSSGWNATRDWATANPDHPEKDAVVGASDYARRDYLSFQKDYFGWAILTGRLRSG